MYLKQIAAKLSKQASSMHATSELSIQGVMDAGQNLCAISMRYLAANNTHPIKNHNYNYPIC